MVVGRMCIRVADTGVTAAACCRTGISGPGVFIFSTGSSCIDALREGKNKNTQSNDNTGYAYTFVHLGTGWLMDEVS